MNWSNNSLSIGFGNDADVEVVLCRVMIFEIPDKGCWKWRRCLLWLVIVSNDDFKINCEVCLTTLDDLQGLIISEIIKNKEYDIW